MSLLDAVLGAAGAMMDGKQQQSQGGGLGGLAGGLGSLGGLGALLPVVLGMLGNDSQHGGLGGLLEKFSQAGMGEMAKSWVGSGQNAPVSGDQLGQVLGGDMMGDIAAKLGLSPGDAAGQLANVLPGLIDKLTPNGHAPAEGLGNSGDLMAMLGGLLRK